ncbi:hypothetical protein [Streptomyces sp. NPDC126514]|uniref:hypothetical protein n=1 Tax=Streptomyces sp. NPDC126514 TaxID=3155210 RepID=UPI003332D91F
MVDTSAEPLDQLLFRWEGNQSQYVTGIAAAAYSCGDQRAEQLRTLLAPLLRVEGAGSRRAGLVRYLVPGTGEAVLIHRRPVLDARGRESTVSHALVGSPEVLTPHESISLAASQWEWTGVPDDATGRIDALPVDVVRRTTEAALPQYVRNVPFIAHRLEVTVAQLLRTPQHRLTFRRRDIYDLDDHNYAPLLIWGLCSMLGPWLGDAAFTFATLDTQEHAGLRLVCVPEWPKSAVGGSAAQRITFSDTVQDQARAVAAELVGLFLTDPARPEHLTKVLAACSAPYTRSLRDRLDTLDRALRGELSGDRHVTGKLRPGVDLLKSAAGFADGVSRGPTRPGGHGTLQGSGQSSGPAAVPEAPVPEHAGRTGSGQRVDLTSTASAADVQEGEQGRAPHEETLPVGGTPTPSTSGAGTKPPASDAPRAHSTHASAPRSDWGLEPHAPADPAAEPVTAADTAHGQAAPAGSGTAQSAGDPPQSPDPSADWLAAWPPSVPTATSESVPSTPSEGEPPLGLSPHRKPEGIPITGTGHMSHGAGGGRTQSADPHGDGPFEARKLPAPGRAAPTGDSFTDRSAASDASAPPPSTPRGSADRRPDPFAPMPDFSGPRPSLPRPRPAQQNTGPGEPPARVRADEPGPQLPVRARRLRRLGKWVSPQWYQQRPHGDAGWLLEWLTRPSDSSAPATSQEIADTLRRLPDRDLCDTLDHPGLKPEHAVRLLNALEERTAWRTLTEALDLAAILLGRRMYLHHGWRTALASQGDVRHGGTAGAVRMFRWAVRPHAREARLGGGLSSLVLACRAESGAEQRQFWQQAAFQPGAPPPDLTPSVWRELARLGPWEEETPRGDQPPAATGTTPRRRKRAARAVHRTPRDDTRKVLVLVLAVLAIFTLLFWWVS